MPGLPDAQRTATSLSELTLGEALVETNALADWLAKVGGASLRDPGNLETVMVPNALRASYILRTLFPPHGSA